MISEAALASAVRAYLEHDGWTTYAEICLDRDRRPASIVGDGRLDIAATRDGQLGIVECKVALSFPLLAQAKRWIPYCHAAWIAFPFARPTTARTEAMLIARDAGLGMLEVDGDEIRHRGSPRVRTHLESDALLVSLKEGQKSHVAAGSKGGATFSEFRQTGEALAAFVAKNPACTLAEAIAGISHHYRTASNAEERLTKMIKKGLVPGVFVGWKQRLWSTPEDARRARTG